MAERTLPKTKKRLSDSINKSIVDIVDAPEYPCKPEAVQIIFNDIKKSDVSKARNIQG